jgi:hypothetical protein
MSFSSFIGGFKWDEGKYDAFETIMEVRGCGTPFPLLARIFASDETPHLP